MGKDIDTFTHSELKALWQKEMGAAPPVSASRKFLMRALAYERQCKRSSGLTRAELKVLAKSLDDEHAKTSGNANTGHVAAKHKVSRPTYLPVKLTVGSRLVREWNGTSYMVLVIKEGFVFKNKVWPSLSAIAKDITGAHWSGPRFFGLHKASGNNVSTAS